MSKLNVVINDTSYEGDLNDPKVFESFHRFIVDNPYLNVSNSSGISKAYFDLWTRERSGTYIVTWDDDPSDGKPTEIKYNVSD